MALASCILLHPSQVSLEFLSNLSHIWQDSRNFQNSPNLSNLSQGAPLRPRLCNRMVSHLESSVWFHLDSHIKRVTAFRLLNAEDLLCASKSLWNKRISLARAGFKQRSPAELKPCTRSEIYRKRSMTSSKDHQKHSFEYIYQCPVISRAQPPQSPFPHCSLLTLQ